ncbi:MAG: hypothetical protein R2749_21240 [Acidimicrobiales bacterium]
MMRPTRSIGGAVIASLAATTALNATTYVDMLLRGRPASSLPSQAADAFARRLHLPLGDPDGDAGAARREGLGALLGIGTGLVGGTAAALSVRGRLPAALGAPAAGLGVMAMSDGANAVAGLSDPRTWSTADWLSDLIPHLVFGAVLVLADGLLDR